MVCPLRYVLFAASAVVAVVTLWLTYYETDSKFGSELDGLTYWQIFKDFMTGGYLWKRYKDWRKPAEPAVADKPCADMAGSRESADSPKSKKDQ
mmetsp:Transcript_7412/g.13831  ORF Transcript_7412/g.13831 Transcript_7412/m.13831 type:complete len:94 (+) Transcript_7412:233-514(+)